MRIGMLTGLVFAMLLGLAVEQPITAGEVDDLIEVLQSEKDAERIEAIVQLGERGSAAAPAVPALSRMLKEQNLVIQHEAIITLGRIGPLAGSAVEPLIGVLKVPSELLRHSAVHALRMIGEEAEPALPHLRQFLSSKDQHLAVAAAWAMIEISNRDSAVVSAALPVLSTALGSEDPSIQADAIFAMASAGPEVVKPLALMVRSDSPALAVGSIDALASMGPSAAPAVPLLLDAAQSEDSLIAWHAARAVGAIHAQATLAVPVLTGLLASESAQVRFSAARALGSYGEEAKSAVNELASLLAKDPEASVRRAAAQSLTEMGPAAADAVSELVAALDDEAGSVTLDAAQSLAAVGAPAVPAVTRLLKRPEYQALAANILGEIGPAAAPAAGELTKLLSSEQARIRSEALLALASIGPDARTAAESVLIERLKDPQATGRAGAAYALARLESRKAIPLLQEAVEDKSDEFLRMASAWALVYLEPDNSEYVKLALPRLIGALSNESQRVRLESARALAKIGPQASVAVPELALAAADGGDPALQAEALAALAAIGPEASEAVPVAIQQLQSESPEVRGPAVYLLGSLGPAAKEAVPVLRKMLTSRDEFDRLLAAWALVYVTPENAEARKEAIPLLLRAVLDSPRIPVRVEAARTLGKIGGNAPLVRNTLSKVAKDDSSEEVREAAAAALDALN